MSNHSSCVLIIFSGEQTSSFVPRGGEAVCSIAFVPSQEHGHLLLLGVNANSLLSLWTMNPWICLQSLSFTSSNSANSCVRTCFLGPEFLFCADTKKVCALSFFIILCLMSTQLCGYIIHYSPEKSCLDYISEFSTLEPVLSFAVTEIKPSTKHFSALTFADQFSVYSYQTKSVRIYSVPRDSCYDPEKVAKANALGWSDESPLVQESKERPSSPETSESSIHEPVPMSASSSAQEIEPVSAGNEAEWLHIPSVIPPANIELVTRDELSELSPEVKAQLEGRSFASREPSLSRDTSHDSLAQLSQSESEAQSEAEDASTSSVSVPTEVDPADDRKSRRRRGRSSSSSKVEEVDPLSEDDRAGQVSGDEKIKRRPSNADKGKRRSPFELTFQKRKRKLLANRWPRKSAK